MKKIIIYVVFLIIAFISNSSYANANCKLECNSIWPANYYKIYVDGTLKTSTTQTTQPCDILLSSAKNAAEIYGCRPSNSIITDNTSETQTWWWENDGWDWNNDPGENTSCTCTDWVVDSCPNITDRSFKPWAGCYCVDWGDVIDCTETNIWDEDGTEGCKGVQIKDWSCCLGTPYDKELIWSELTKCCNGELYKNEKKCCERWSAVIDDACVSCSAMSTWELEQYADQCSDDLTNCKKANRYTEWPLQKCCDWIVQTGSDGKAICVVNNYWDAWIWMNTQCLTNGQCSYNIYKTLWIRKSDQNPKVSSFVQDIVLAATMFIWTVVSLVLIVSGILYILAWITWNTTLADKAKKWITWSVLWLILVVTSYSIVRLIQFLATAWWW